MKQPWLLPPSQLIKTGDVDHADWNFRCLLGHIQRTRFRMVLSLLQKDKPHRLLEIGYGSGIFMPELSLHCSELYGVDIHARQREVMDVLNNLGVNAVLSQGTAEVLDFPSGHFDCIVAVSSLEFIGDIRSASEELRRVLSPEGHLILVTPGHSLLVDFGLRILTGASARKDYGCRRQGLLVALGRNFQKEKQMTFPPLCGSYCLYRARRLKPGC